MDFESLFIGLLLILSYLAWKFIPRLIARVPFIDPGDAKAQMDADQIEIVIDVRSYGDFIGKKGHIKGAISLPYGYLGEKLKKVSDDLQACKHEPVLVTAASENLAAHAVRLLRNAGFTKLGILKGGMKSWQSRGLPVEYGIPPEQDAQ